MMKISGLQKLTLLDFPGKTAATVFTPGCNFRCPFCHNADLVQGVVGTSGAVAAQRADDRSAAGTAFPDIPLDEFFAFLDKRRGLLDGVCITGGEPLMQPGLAAFCGEIKQRGFAIKLDTNGSFPARLRELVEAGLVDYVAMDVKNCRTRYAETIGVPGFDPAPIEETVAYLLTGAVPYEFRTTVVREYHDAENLASLAHWIANADAWHLQAFVDSDTVLAGEGTLHGYSVDEMRALLPALSAITPNVQVRGI